MGVQPASQAEWPASLDVSRLIAGGWSPVPFREFVLKVHSRCDLACDYCYMYTMADQSWRQRPARMSRPVADRTAERIAEHVSAHRLTRIKVILHGGEPLLAGTDLIGYVVASVRAAVGSHVHVDVTVQSNGTRLDKEYLDCFLELGVRVGISIDGDVSAQDRHRRYSNGRGSYAAVNAALALLASERYRGIFGGLLCTVDLRNDPTDTYEALLRSGPPMIDFLLPHRNWASPPASSAESPYGDWLAAVFDRWYQAPVRETRVRLFAEIMHGILGGASTTESVGLSPVAVAVIDSDGTIEQSDNLRSAYPGAQATGLHVDRDSFDRALLEPGIVARQIGAMALSPECRGCQAMQVCGGGQYAHRYRPGTGFLNPSVYCADLFRLIAYISRTMRQGVAGLRAGGE